MHRFWLLLLGAPLLGLLASTVPAGAHPMFASELSLEVHGRTYQGQLLLDAPPDGGGPQMRAAKLEQRVRSGLYLKADGAPQHYGIEVEGLGDPTSDSLSATDRIHIAGVLPDDIRELSVRVTPRFGAWKLEISAPDRRPAARWTIPGGSETPPLLLSRLQDRASTFTEGAPGPSQQLSPSFPGRLAVVKHHLLLGFEHILPLGLDHVLFVLALFFFSPRLKPLLVQLTAFTLAHSLTLALVCAGVMSPPAALVEPLIAASILFVGVENLWRRHLGAARVIVVVVFGLLHGMGFAGVLGAMGLPLGQEWLALFAFNVGVELGQIAVVLLALALTWPAQARGEHPRWVRVPASGAIAVMGLFWMIERLLP